MTTSYTLDENAAAARRSKAFVFFCDNKPLVRVVGPEASIPIDLEVKQVQAGVLWTMFTAVKDTLSRSTRVDALRTSRTRSARFRLRDDICH
jgi:hypothetical protein